MLSGVFFIVAFLVVLFLPGGAWLVMIRADRLDPLEWIAEAIGASLALTALLALYLSLLGIQLGAAGVIGLYAAALVLGAGFTYLRRHRIHLNGWILISIGFVLAVIAWRLYQARELVLPAWVDSVHHVLLVRKMVEFGGLPPGWQPYLPVPMYYHFGFHILAASFTFWSRMEPAQGVLLLGQVLNACVAFSIYRLAKAAWADARVAGLAGLMAAFGFHMPAYYLTWGRYPLLAGLVVLPLAMAAALEIRRDPRDFSAWLRLALYTAGVCLCHYLALGILAVFLLVLLAAEGFKILRGMSFRSVVWQPYVAAALGGLAALPWIVRVWGYTRQSFSVSIPDPIAAVSGGSGPWEYIIYLTGPQRSHILLLLAGIGFIYLLLRRQMGWLVGWSLLLALLATPFGPRFDPFRPDHIAIVLFLPGSLLLAGLLVGLAKELERLYLWLSSHWLKGVDLLVRIRRQALGVGWILPLLAGAGLAGWGLWETRDIVNPVTVLVVQADETALRWVDANLPGDARFFINGVPWQGKLYRGVDGGYWLLPVTGRFSVIPPAAFGWGYLDDIQRFLDWSKRAGAITACDEAFWSLVRDAGLTHVYLREGVGSLQASALVDCAGVERIYAQDGVAIFAIR